jgi:uncharacterized protein (TIGR03083 family)
VPDDGSAPPRIDFVEAVRREAAALSAVAHAGPLDAPVEACPGWDVARLVGHVGSVHRWATAAVVTGVEPDRRSLERPPKDREAIAAWFDAGIGPLAEALTEVDDDAPIWNFSAGPDVGRFWPRRQAHETAVHRWDGQRAVGSPEPIEVELAVDGIDEVLDVWGRTILGGRDGIDIGGSVRVVATDGADRRSGSVETWTVWTDDGVYKVSRNDAQVTADVTLRGPASDLLLALWRRQPPAAGGLIVDGDATILDRWLRLGVP